ncbi:MAG: radical SAM protein [Nitrospiraceae bacterium]|nr:MAG: radical SAM protein [Nitrospiraceae bacterium]
MHYFLTKEAVLKRLETPSVYHIKKDELYELDNDAFRFLEKCQAGGGCSAKESKFTGYCIKEGILTTEKNLLKHPHVIKSPKPSLRYLELQVTDRCNLKCKHCYIGQRQDNELSLSRIRKILHEFEQMQGLRVLITGGEPLLHSRFEEINEMLPQFFIRKILFTNGLLLSKKILKSLNADEIQISIDGLEKAHESLRGKGTFKKAIEAVKNAIDTGFEVSISTMVHSENLGDFDKMEALFKGLGIKDWTVDVPCISGSLKRHAEFQIAPDIGGKYLAYGYGDGLHSGALGIACGLHLMSVMADGRTAKCTFYADRNAGNLKDGLRECWQKIKPIKLSKLKCNCKYIEVCRGGCRYRAELLGDSMGKDPYRCALYGV